MHFLLEKLQLKFYTHTYTKTGKEKNNRMYLPALPLLPRCMIVVIILQYNVLPIVLQDHDIRHMIIPVLRSSASAKHQSNGNHG